MSNNKEQEEMARDANESRAIIEKIGLGILFVLLSALSTLIAWFVALFVLNTWRPLTAASVFLFAFIAWLCWKPHHN